MSYLELKINFKNNSDFFKNKNETELNDYIKELFYINNFEIYILYPAKTYDSNDFKNPVSNRIESDTLMYLDWYYKVNMNFYFEEFEYIKDTDRFLSLMDKQNHIRFSHHENIYEPKYSRDVSTKDGREIVSIYIRPTLLNWIVSVKRKKATLYLSEAFSLILLIFKAFAFCLHFFNDFHGSQEIMIKTCKIEENIKTLYGPELKELLNLTKSFENNAKNSSLLDNNNNINNNKDKELKDIINSPPINDLNDLNESKRVLNKKNSQDPTNNYTKKLIELNLNKNNPNNNPEGYIINNDMKINTKFRINDNENERENIKKKYTDTHRRLLKVRFWDFVKQHSICFKNNENLDIMEFLRKKFNYNYDIINYLDMMNEFRFLKKILINEELDQIFEYISMTSFTFNEKKKKKKKKKFHLKDLNEQFDISKLKDSFQFLRFDKEIDSQINAKLIDLLKKDIIDINNEQ